MTDRPIIFSGPMVRALLAGRKSQTRRLATSPLHRCAPGDRLYVREGYMPIPWIDDAHPNRWNLAYAATGGGDHFADAPASFNPTLYGHERWTPSIHMPRWASRLTLIVEDVRIEPLQAISEPDAIAEGIEQVGRFGGERLWKNYSDGPTAAFVCPIKSYRLLWNSLHAKEGERWEDNPSVVALTFRVVLTNIDKIGSET